MRRLVAILSLFLGLGALLLATSKLVLLSMGDTVEGVITRADTQDPETEIRRQRRSAGKATGYFKIDIEVDYRFDVLPTPVEALKRLSDAPLHKDVQGSDTMHWRSRDPQARPLSVGAPLRILYLRAMPKWNRAYQPGSIKGEMAIASVAGLALVLLGLALRRNAPVRS